MVHRGCRSLRRRGKFLSYRIGGEIDHRAIEILCQAKLDVPKA
jgi:hypothetical protein